MFAMPPRQGRWSRGERQGCAYCGKAGPLTADSSDGRSYCAACWEYYYGKAPPSPAPVDGETGGLAAAEAVASAVRAAAASVAASSSSAPPREACDGASGDVAQRSDASQRRRAEEEAKEVRVADAAASAPDPCWPEAPAAEASAPAVRGRLARFGAEVAELRRLCAASEAADDAERAEAAEQQKMELETLDAIYGEGLRVLSAPDEQPVLLRLELPVELEGGGPAEIVLQTEEGEVPAGMAQELPPMVLLCALPQRYPLELSGRGPPVLIEAEHLPDDVLAELEAHLEGLAEQHQGEPLLFYWASALQERPAEPRRLVLPQVPDAMDLALRLLAHSDDALRVRRDREMHTCPVCMDEVLGSRGVFLGCGHFGCRPCLEEMAKLHTKEADIGALRCPTWECREAFGIEVLRELLGADSEALAKWEEVSLQRCLEGMEDVAYCPRCDLDATGHRVPCIADDDGAAQCGACGFVFCARCRGVYHPGTDCPTVDDQLEALEAKAAGTGPEAKAAQAELMSLRHLAKTTKRCPRCDMAIEKTEGCSKVVCGNCKGAFCWRCGKEINGYDHFASGECRLFDDEEIRRWNQRVKVNNAQARAHEARFLAQFLDPARLWEQMRGCPRCKAGCLRDGKNNHMRCHACQTQWCARCGQVLPKNGAGEHFQRLKICPQHSDD